MKTSASASVLLLNLILFSSITMAQIVFTAADAVSGSTVGNVAKNYSNFSINSANIGIPGGGNIWNFGSITPLDSSKDYIVAPASTPYISDFPGSNLVSTSTTIQPPYTTIVYVYDILRSGSLVEMGQEGTSNSDTSTLWSKLVDDPAPVVVPLPFTYNSRWGSKFTTHSTTIHDGVNNGTTNFPITDSSLVDAYGTITMPDGAVLDALRVRRVLIAVRPNGTYKTTVTYTFYTIAGHSLTVSPADSLPPNSGTILINGVSWGITNMTGAISISKPGAAEILHANASYNITWSTAGISSPVRISYSTDAGNTFTTIANNVVANAGSYLWDVPDVLSAKCIIDIVDIADSTIKGVAGYFKIKGYVLTRINNKSDYEKFEPGIHGWQYINREDIMWPQTWWSQFNYQNGIDPYTNKPYPADFSKKYPSTFPDWPLWVSVFTPAQCYVAPGVYNAKALLKWKRFSDSTFKGSCFGFSQSSFLAFDYTNQFVVANPGIPAFTILYDLPLNDAIQSVINGEYILQAGKQTQDFNVIASQKDPRTTLQEVKDMFFSEDPNIQTLNIFNNNGQGGGGHSIAPYKLIHDPDIPADYDLLVYNCNAPGDTTGYIEIDSINNMWYNQIELPPSWKGNSHFYLELPVSNYLNTPLFGKMKTGKIQNIVSTDNIEFYNSPNANVMYTSSTGKRIGLIDSTVTNEIVNGIPIFKQTGYSSNPIGFYIPDDIYSLVLTNPHSYSGKVYLTAIKSNVIYNYERDSTISTQTDWFKIDNGFSVTSPDQTNKLVNFEVVAESDTLERIMFVKNTQLAKNDSLYLQQVNQSNYIMKNYGSATLINNGRFKYALSTSDQTIADINYSGLELSYTGTGFNKNWTLGGNRVISDSLETNNSAVLVLSATAPQSLTVNGTLRLTSGTLNNSNANTTLIMGDGAKISKATAILSAAPIFAGKVNLSYTSSSLVNTGFEVPSLTSVLNDLTVSGSGGINLGSNITVNHTLTLTSGLINNTGTYPLTLGEVATVAGGSNTSFVNGPIIITARNTTPMVAPVGKGVAYRPITAVLSSLVGTGALTAEQIENPPSGAVVAAGDPILSAVRYFQITQSGLTSATVDLTLSWGSDDGILAPEQLTIVGSSDGGITWPYAGNSPYISYSGTPSTGSVTVSSLPLSLVAAGNCSIGSFSGNPMPVNLTSFTAVPSNGSVKLNWNTAVETANHGFDVERSVDKSSWAKLSFIQGQGNSNTSRNYSYTDNSVTKAGKYFYRLKQIDNNGGYKYSCVVEADYILPTVYSLNQNYPNPFNPNTMISYALPMASNVKISVYNAIGETVQILENGYKNAGNYSVSFNAANIPSGIYFYRIDAGKFSQVRKMMLIK